MKNEFYSYYLDTPLVPGRVFDVFEPEKITKDVSLFIIHGGRWRTGSRTTFHSVMEAFNNEGYRRIRPIGRCVYHFRKGEKK